MADVTLLCKECGRQFNFTAKEQQFYIKQGFEHVPTRCPDCRLQARARRDKGREFVSIKCRVTGKVGRLPFSPDDPNDAYTEEAFNQVFAAKGRYVDPQQEPDRTALIEAERQKKAASQPPLPEPPAS